MKNCWTVEHPPHLLIKFYSLFNDFVAFSTGTVLRFFKHPRWQMSGVTLSPVSNTTPNKPRYCML